MTPIAVTLAVLVIGAWGGSHLVATRGRGHGRRLLRCQGAAAPTADQWAALLDAIAADVRSGSSLTAACARAITRARPNGSIVRPGCPLPVGPTPTGAAVDADEAVVVQAIAAAQALGGPVAATLHAGAALLRERAAIRAEAHAHSAQARLSARVLTTVPLAFAGWSLLSSKSFRVALLSPIGLASAALGGLCNLLGWWWMRRIVAGATA